MKQYWWIIIPGLAWAAAAVIGATGARSDQRGVAFAAVMVPSVCAALVSLVAFAISAAGGMKTRRQVEISGSGPLSLRRMPGGFRVLVQEGGGTAEVTVDLDDEQARRVAQELDRTLGQSTPEPTQ